MNLLERTAASIRHAPGLNRMKWLWDAVRPAYEKLYAVLASGGLRRIINGTDTLRLSPRLRSFPPTYEPETWQLLMKAVRPGDHFVDVGAFVGIYALAIANRVGPTGRVTAFEPDAENHDLLCENVRLNGSAERVRCERSAVGSHDGQVQFLQGKSTESRLLTADPGQEAGSGSTVPMVCLDTFLANEKVDLLKIDVEGFELTVLEGARGLLSDAQRRPRSVFVEVHPFNWHLSGATSDALLGLLREHGYTVRSLDGQPVTEVREYGEIIATRTQADAV